MTPREIAEKEKEQIAEMQSERIQMRDEIKAEKKDDEREIAKKNVEPKSLWGKLKKKFKF